MMKNYKMNILEVTAKEGLITHAKYFAEASNGEHTVQTEGNWYFQDPQLVIPYEDVTEQNIAEWIEQETMQDGINLIKSNLEKQLESLQNSSKTELPWLAATFTIE